MSKRAVDAVFTSLFSLTDIRVTLRETAPTHELSDDQKAYVSKNISTIKKQLEIIEDDLL